MNIIQITPGAGKMFCGGCFRDNALVAALRRQGHAVTMLPLYLPLTLDEADASAGTPIFFSGINVYLEQKSGLFRNAPNWLRNFFASPRMLAIASGFAAKTRAADVGDLTVSMLRGEGGYQARELQELIAWLKTHEKPDVISLSNALLVGLARQLKAELNVPVICSLQGEDFFLDSLPENFRAEAWRILAERAADVDLFIAPSRYFAELMGRRLHLPPEKIQVIYNGIQREGFPEKPHAPISSMLPPSIGFFARMCPEKGLDQVVDAFLELKKRNTIDHLQLKVGGSCGPMDEPFVQKQKDKLAAAGALGDVEFHPNLNRAEKIAFLESLSVFTVPAPYGEAFGLYIIEAWATGTPVVQPWHGAFPELMEAAGGGGVLYEEGPGALANALENLLRNATQAAAMGKVGYTAVTKKFTADIMAKNLATACERARGNFKGSKAK